MKFKIWRSRIVVAGTFTLVAALIAVALTSAASLLGSRNDNVGAIGSVFASEAESKPLSGHKTVQPRPIPMGVSIGNTPSLPFIYAGTAGMRVRSFNNPDWKFILSNNHVMGAIGPTLCPDTAPPGTWVLQPGSLDLGFDPGQNPVFIAGVVAAKVPIVMSPVANNLVDAAIAFTTEGLARTEILDIGQPNVAFKFPAPGMEVTKSGRTTEVTTGTVQSVNGTFQVGYGEDCGSARFIGQVTVTPGTFSSGGDSGSVILEKSTKTPVALLFAGSPSQTIANHLLFVYLLLGVFVDGPTTTEAVSQQQLVEQVEAMNVDPQMARLRRIQAVNQDTILAIPNVVGIGIGLTEDGNDSAFIVYVEEFTDEVVKAVPTSLDGVPVRLIESGGPFEAR